MPKPQSPAKLLIYLVPGRWAETRAPEIHGLLERFMKFFEKHLVAVIDLATFRVPQETGPA
uniref:Uncharacterized protein n=1 Tax=uncultured Verrucomicrobiota bacterium TaxID=156588 RepID=D2DXS6_9BACT|nr:hypothetical protein [uncultured Verrucomicrobiota bacterium]